MSWTNKNLVREYKSKRSGKEKEVKRKKFGNMGFRDNWGKSHMSWIDGKNSI